LSTGSGPLAVAAWLASLLMAGFMLHAGQGVLIPLALAVLIWQLINAISARFQQVRIAGRSLRAGSACSRAWSRQRWRSGSW
jgi:hypothetical protein